MRGLTLGWIYLFLAGAIEVLFTTAIRYSEGFTKLAPTIMVLVLAGLSFYFLSRSIETIPLGTAYAVWGALGAAGTVVVGIVAFNEPIEALRLFFIGLIIISVVGLKVVTE